MNPADVLMVGLGCSAPMYYRILLPAHELGIDYVGLVGEPPDALYRTGLVGGKSVMADLTAYKTVVVQQPKGRGWLEVITALQAQGTVVIYEVDDYLHAIRKRTDHDHADKFTAADLADYELCMKACDAMIVSTDYLAAAYGRFNSRVAVCRNGIDANRYALTRPPRRDVTIGWAGATGHAKTIEPWLRAVAEIMEARIHTRFVAIGQPGFAKPFHPRFGRRAVGVPFAAIEQYPAAMTMLDIALAPGSGSEFSRAKSDLRFLEAGALGIPVIGSPLIYPEIEHGVTGFHAKNAGEARRYMLALVDDAELRASVGAAAREYVLAHRTMRHAAQAWADVFEEVAP